MARTPRPWYADGAWRTDFGGVRNRVLIRGPENADTRLSADKALLRLREEAKLLRHHNGINTPFSVVVERFLECYVGRPVYTDFYNELHWFMGGTTAPATDPSRRQTNRGKNRGNGGRFGIPCKNWPIYRVNADIVERYLRRRKAAGLSGYHAYVTIRTLLNWARMKDYIPSHDLDEVDKALRRKGRRRYIPDDKDVAGVFKEVAGKFKDILLAFTYTGIRPKELRTVTIEEFERDQQQLVLWRHKTVDRTGMPKVVPLGTDELVSICVKNAGERGGHEPLFVSDRGEPWTYNALRLRWYRLRKKVGLDSRFTLYSLRHWYLTLAVESGEDGAIVSELAGHTDQRTLDFYKKIRNPRLHQAARRVAQTIERVGISTAPAVPAT